MKKFLNIIIICLFCLSLYACGNKAFISYETNSISLYLNETYTIDSDKIDTNSLESYSIISLDETIAKVQDYVIYPLSSGSTTVRIAFDDKTYFDIVVNVLGGNLATNVSVDNSSVIINMGEMLTSLNKITTNSDCTEIPQVTYDTNIMDYDYTSGVITAKASGNTIVNIKYEKCETSFSVTIHNTVYTKQMTVEDNYIFTNSEGKLDFKIFPMNSTTYRFWTSNDNLTILRDGSYKTKGTTTATVYYQYYEDYNRQSEIKSFTVNVINKISSINVEVFTLEDNSAKSFIIDKTYKMKITTPSSYTQNNFLFSTNIELKSSVQMIDEFNYEVNFKFNYIGEQILKVTIIEDLGDVENKVVSETSVNVLDKNNVQITAKWSAYKLEKSADGNYHLYLNSQNQPNEIYFNLELGGEIIYDAFTVYLVLNEEVKVVSERLFHPTNAGEYIFEIEYDGLIVGRVSVIVNEL